MRLVPESVFGEPCPHCGEKLEAQATWECDEPPYPDQTADCPACGKPVAIEQRVVTTLSKG